MRDWVKWCINHNLKAVLYVLWVVTLPFYLMVDFPKFIKQAWNDCIYDLEVIKRKKKGQV